MTLKELKQELKTLAETIREKRRAHRDGQRTASAWDVAHPGWSAMKWSDPVRKERWEVYGKIPGDPDYESDTFRYKHVAYCMARGRKYEEIEPKVSPGNELEMNRVEAILAQVTYEPKTLCPSAS